MKVLLGETKLGGTLAIAFQQSDDEEEIGFNIMSYSAATTYAIRREFWRQFVRSVNQADVMLKLEDLAN